MEHRCRQGSTDGTSVSLRWRPAGSEGGAAVACGADGVCGVYLARAVLREVQEHNNETFREQQLAGLTAAERQPGQVSISRNSPLIRSFRQV
jgi:hypothetical protein